MINISIQSKSYNLVYKLRQNRSVPGKSPGDTAETKIDDFAKGRESDATMNNIEYQSHISINLFNYPCGKIWVKDLLGSQPECG